MMDRDTYLDRLATALLIVALVMVFIGMIGA